MKCNRLHIILILAIILCSSCADVPDNIKNKPQGQSEKMEIGRGVSVDRLTEGIGNISEYIIEKDYDSKFILDNNVNVFIPDALYELETETVKDAYLVFPELYYELFGENFFKKSGVSSLSELPLYSKKETGEGFWFDDHTTVGDGIIYDDGSDNPDRIRSSDGSAKHLHISTGGFLFYQYDFEDENGNVSNILNAVNVPLPEKEYTMRSGESYSIKSAVGFANNKLQSLFSNFSDSYTYRVGRVYPRISAADGKAWFDLDIEKCYEGVPFCNHIIAGYEPGEKRELQAVYTGTIDAPDHFSIISAPFGFDKVTSSKKLDGALVPLSQALDIMNNELAPKIELHISDIRLMYMCYYDASDVEEAEKLYKEHSEMTWEQTKVLSFPELVPGRKCKAYPVWAFIIDDFQKDSEGNYLEKDNCEMITVDVQTGELTLLFDRIASR